MKRKECQRNKRDVIEETLRTGDIVKNGRPTAESLIG
jgi:hypothetical protein